MNKLAIVIPFKSKKVSSNWASDQALLKRTILSVLNQKSLNYILYVVTSDPLDFTIEHPNLVLLNYKHETISIDDIVDVAKPRRYYKDDHILKIMDKCKRLHVGFDEARLNEYPYVMALDADDLISNNIVELLQDCKQQDNYGWFMTKGYIYQENSSYLLRQTNMFQVCAGTYILRTDLVKQPRKDKLYFKDLDIFHSHGYLKQFIKDKYGYELKPILFPGIIYVAHSSNLGSISEKLNSGFVKKFLKFIIKGSPISKKIKKEFNFYNIN